MVVVRSVSRLTSTAGGSDACNCGSNCLTRSTTWITLAPGWRWMLTMIAGCWLTQAACRTFSAASTTSATSDSRTGAAIAVGDDQRPVFVGRAQLVVGIDGIGLRRAVEAALGLVDVGVGDGGAHVLDIQAVGRQRARVDLDPHRRPLAAGEADQADAGQLRNLLRQPGVGQSLHLRQRQRLRGQRQRQDRRVGGIDLAVDRRRRQVRRQQIAAGIDRRLHFLLRDVEAQGQAELQGDHRGAAGTGGRHLVQARHLAELALQRRGHRRCHHVRTGARIQRDHLDRRVIDFRQGRQRQHPVGDDADQENRRHQQRGRHRTQDERARDVHVSTGSEPPGRGLGWRMRRSVSSAVVPT